MGTHLRVLSERYPISTNITGFKRFQKSLCPCAFDEISLEVSEGSTSVHLETAAWILGALDSTKANKARTHKIFRGIC